MNEEFALAEVYGPYIITHNVTIYPKRDTSMYLCSMPQCQRYMDGARRIFNPSHLLTHPQLAKPASPWSSVLAAYQIRR